MPKDVEECVRSVQQDNPDMDESQAYAICQDLDNKGELADADVDASACGEGMVEINGECRDVESVEDVPPSSLKHSAPVFQLAGLDTEPITREELGDNKVRYANIKILSAGTWTDAASRETVWYSPEGISNLQATEDNVVNIMHDVENEVSAAGHIEPGSLHAEGGDLYADVVLDTTSTAGEYADKNLQKTLETKGAKGFGGPSVEIDGEGQQIEYNAEKGMPELKGGRLSGMGFVSSPASKPTAFSRQVAERGAALSSGEESISVYLQERHMATAEVYREILESNGVDTGEMSDDEVLSIYEDLMEAAEEEPDEDEPEEEEPEMEENGENPDDEPEEPEDDDVEMEDELASLEERITALEDMMDSVMAAEDVQGELEELQSELADAKELQELREAKDDLEKRLSEVEDEPVRKTLADSEGEDGGFEAVYDSTPSQSSSW